jgi:hypothetical protein
MQYIWPPFWKIHITPHVIRHTLLHPHVIRIRIYHLLEIWLVAFRIYDICKNKHILRKYMIIRVNNSEVVIADLSMRNPLKWSWVWLNFLEVIICSTNLLLVMCYLYYYSDYSFNFFLLLWYAIYSIVSSYFLLFCKRGGLGL